MHKKTSLALIFAAALLIFGAATVTYGEPSVGVKKGDWIEYIIETTGTPPPEQDFNWVRIEILDVKGVAFHANFTVRYVNGTVTSAIRNFNFTEGVADWTIIPSNLGPGDTFYDSSKQDNVTVEGQKQKTVAGARRTITYANDSIRNKEWDKATGVFTSSNDIEGNYTLNTQAVATNIWNPQILGLEQLVFFAVVTLVIVIIAAASALVIVRRRRSH